MCDFSRLSTWYKEHFKEAHFASAAGGTVRYCLSVNNRLKGTVVLVHGRTEFIEKYFELMKAFWDHGLAIGSYDHIGQGKSTRLLTDPQKGHIQFFGHYLADLQKMLLLVQHEKPGQPVYLVTHSMGSLIAAMHVRGAHHSIAKLVMSAPMFGIRTGRLLRPPIAKLISALACLFGAAESYAWGTERYCPNRVFEHNALTSDKGRFEHNRMLVGLLPEVALNGPTFGWLQAAFRAMRWLKKQRQPITIPVLIFQAEYDRVVEAQAMRDFASQAVNVQLVEVGQARHEMFMERDHIRSAVLEQTIRFLLS